jgi:hypothetical protein
MKCYLLCFKKLLTTVGSQHTHDRQSRAALVIFYSECLPLLSQDMMDSFNGSMAKIIL